MTQPAAKTTKTNPLTWVLTLSGVFFLLFMIVSGGFYLYRSPAARGAKSAAGFLTGEGSVGVIELNGVILDSKKILKKLDTFAEDDSVSGVVLRLNSPGGAVAPSQEIYEAVKAYKKPIYASMSSVAASGAYYIACGTKKVYANAGTITGSIGVIMEFINLQKLYEWAKVQRYAVKTGKFKDVGAEYRDMAPEDRKLLQDMVDDVLSQFRKAVAEGRKLPMERVVELSDGRVFSGQQAKAVKLVDELGTLQDAVEAVAAEAKIKGKPRVVYPERQYKNRFLDLVLDEGHDEEARTDVGLLQRLAHAVLGAGAAAQMPSVMEPGIYWVWKGAY